MQWLSYDQFLTLGCPPEVIISEASLTISLSPPSKILLPGDHHPHADDDFSSGGPSDVSSGSGSSGGVSSGGSSEGSSGSASGESSGGSGSSSAASSSAAFTPEKRNANGLKIVWAAISAVAGIAAAAIFMTRTVVKETTHALVGSIKRRMILFNKFAGKAGKHAARPQRAVHTTADGDYDGGTMRSV